MDAKGSYLLNVYENFREYIKLRLLFNQYVYFIGR